MKAKIQKIGVWFLEAYWVLSFFSLGICDDATGTEIFAVIANFTLASFLLRFVPLPDDSDRV